MPETPQPRTLTLTAEDLQPAHWYITDKDGDEWWYNAKRFDLSVREGSALILRRDSRDTRTKYLYKAWGPGFWVEAGRMPCYEGECGCDLD